jgi:hypothetical protein
MPYIWLIYALYMGYIWLIPPLEKEGSGIRDWGLGREKGVW